MKLLVPIILFISATAFADVDRPHVQVQGNCEVSVIPDRGSILFTSENQSNDQKEAVKKTNDQINKLKQRLTSLDLKNVELKNTNYSVYPVREYEKEKYVDKGFRASLSLELKTSDIARIGEALYEASKTGITQVGSLETSLSQEKSQAEYLKCLDIAADDARNKAKQLGQKLGFKIGEVLALNEVPSIPTHSPRPERFMMKTALADSAPTQIESGKLLFSTNIQVTFSIK